ncbi:TIGR02569 family protein [Phytoactinopolyspora endophytica]|uniref:TIGR02569 family protein n=1 Tax=Phytoactinopolyspora endophytica TaxID=1642495 RepID=UPI00101B988B|nr:TIGR02569 family protein [Phytoactinopolyspora endophytica]
MTAPPSRETLASFGVPTDGLRPLDGGQGTSWRAGDLVLKPVDNPVETGWRAEVLASIAETEEFRVARPARTLDGRWTADGWQASYAVTGQEDHGRPDDVLRAGAAFHSAVRTLPRPSFLDTRDDPWTFGDRMAWEESPVIGSDAVLSLLEPLAAQRCPVDLPSQVVHGDLLGNVLFAEGHAPAVIDWPVYFRPPQWAAAVVVCDAMTWYKAPPDLADRWSHLAEWKQMLVRALIYRIATDDAASGFSGPPPSITEAYRPVIEAVGAV